MHLFIEFCHREKRLENRINFEEIQKKFRAKSPLGHRKTVIQPESFAKSPKKDSQMSFHGNFLTEE